MKIEPIHTDIFHPRQDLTAFMRHWIPRPQERMVVAVTTKIVSLAENRLVPQKNCNKRELIEREADLFLGEIAHGSFLTVKEGLLIPSAGIDESNSETGDFILYPKDPTASARVLHGELSRAWNLRELGILFTDSRTSPLRRGVTGVAVAYWGFKGLRDMVGSEDLFGRKLKMTVINQVDGLAAAAALVMGEGIECQPLAVISGVDLEFSDKPDHEDLRVAAELDLYARFFKY